MNSLVICVCAVLLAGIAQPPVSRTTKPAATAPSSAAAQPGTSTADVPATIAGALFAADRGYAAAARSRPLREALGAMFTDDVMMPGPRGQILNGKAVLDAIGATADSTARGNWTPIRVGLSSDGLHGFTVGFMVTTRADGGRGQYKYLAYWVRDSAQGSAPWRVAAWRRRAIDSSVAIDSTVLPPVLPARLQPPRREAASLATLRKGLIEAEAGFSNEAQRIGVGAAFAAMGTEESLNVGSVNEGRFTRGAIAIARAVASGQALDAPSTIVWSADTAIVAGSGDLGITFGVIRAKGAPAGQTAPGTSFFTIWRRASPTAPWRYIAE
jgi:hypothetical protein